MDSQELIIDILSKITEGIDNAVEDIPPHLLLVIIPAIILVYTQLMNIMQFMHTRHQKTNLQHVLDFGYRLGKLVPIVKEFIEAEVKKELAKQYESDLVKISEQRRPMPLRVRMPASPLSAHEILKAFDINPGDLSIDFDALLVKYPDAREFKTKRGQGKDSGSLYAAPPREFIELLKTVIGETSYVNSLRDSDERISAMRAEVIRWALNLFHGSDNGYGLITHGGTTSIIEAISAYVRGKERPEIIVPDTAHAAFFKAADLTGAKLVVIPVDPQTGAVRAADVEARINSHTAVIVGSAPSFMNGINDPISELGKIALKRNVPLHVDACLGGFLTAFLDTSSDPMDFRVPGVSSISADTHKYGCAPKGTSFLLFSDKSPALSVYPALNWKGGFYVTPGILDGSAAGARVAELYTTMAYYGESRYKEIAEKIIATRKEIQAQVMVLSKDFDIHVFGNPKWSVLGFQSQHLNPHVIAMEMTKLGWKLDMMQNPNGFHLCLTHVHVLQENFVENFIHDLKQAIMITAEYPADYKLEGMAKAYGQINIAPTEVQQQIGKLYEKARLFLPRESIVPWPNELELERSFSPI